MRKVVEQILAGDFERELPTLDFSCGKVELTLKKGETVQSFFDIVAPIRGTTRGYVTASDSRMECLTPSFEGPASEISYRFHGEKLEEGESVRGKFCVVSNRGEFFLPFEVTVEGGAPSSSQGKLENLEQFAALAGERWEEAVRFFYTPDFERLLAGREEKYLYLYRGFAAHPGNQRNVDRFLTAAGKKERIAYRLEEESVALECVEGVREISLRITRSGWGCTRLGVSTEGDFLYSEKEVLTEDDFLGEKCRLPLYVDSRLLHGGKNWGAVILADGENCIRIPVTVDQNNGTKRDVVTKKILAQLMGYYQSYRLRRISTATWLREAGELVSRLYGLPGEDPTAGLFRAHLLITGERLEEAGWLLENIREQLLQGYLPCSRQESLVLRAYYLYLTTRINKEAEYVSAVAEEVYGIYRESGGAWRVAWLMLHLTEAYDNNPVEKWDFLREQFERGCHSPILYVEALLLINANPALLRSLDSFELQVLCFGMRREALTEDVREQVYYLAGRRKEYSALLYRLLVSCYDEMPAEKILKEICTLLIKGNRVGKEYFIWFQRGVEAELRITKLYEYYMMSLDLEGETELPKGVLLYFTYQSNLDYLHQAYLYSYIHRRREQYPEIYETYLPRIRQFVEDQIRREHMGRHLAYLYREFLREDMIDGQSAPALSRLLFARFFKTSLPGWRSLVVHRSRNFPEKGFREVLCPLSGDGSWIPLYRDDYEVFLEGAGGERRLWPREELPPRWIDPEPFVPRVAALAGINPELDLYVEERENGKGDPAADPSLWESLDAQESLGRWFRLMETPGLSREKKRQLSSKILGYYEQLSQASGAQEARLDAYLERLPGRMLAPRERGEAIRAMVSRGRFDQAYLWVTEYGRRGVDRRTLSLILEDRILRTGAREDGELVSLCYYLLRKGRCGDAALAYLARYYRGSLGELMRIWKALPAQWEDRCELAGRILVQVLFTGSPEGEYTEVFRNYISLEPEREVEDAFLARCSYGYFAGGQEPADCLWGEMDRIFQMGEVLPDACKLAYLKYYACHRELIGEHNRDVIQAFLCDMLKMGVRLKLFYRFTDMQWELFPMLDRSVVEYQGHPDSRVFISYPASPAETGELRREEMQPVLGGVCFKEFVLFAGEKLPYRITEEREGEVPVILEGELSRDPDQPGERNGRFHQINRAAADWEAGEDRRLEEDLEDYYRREYLNGALFALKK